MPKRNHTHINWRERVYLLGKNNRSPKRLRAAEACGHCLYILQFKPKYKNADLAEAEYIHGLRSFAIPVETISAREGLSSMCVVDRIKLWQLDTDVKELIENGDMAVAEAMRLVRA